MRIWQTPSPGPARPAPRAPATRARESEPRSVGKMAKHQLIRCLQEGRVGHQGNPEPERTNRGWHPQCGSGRSECSPRRTPSPGGGGRRSSPLLSKAIGSCWEKLSWASNYGARISSPNVTHPMSHTSVTVLVFPHYCSISTHRGQIGTDHRRALWRSLHAAPHPPPFPRALELAFHTNLSRWGMQISGAASG